MQLRFAVAAAAAGGHAVILCTKAEENGVKIAPASHVAAQFSVHVLPTALRARICVRFVGSALRVDLNLHHSPACREVASQDELVKFFGNLPLAQKVFCHPFCLMLWDLHTLASLPTL